MVERDKVVEMLSRGYSQSVVASAVGCTDSYIAQILEDQEVRDLISAKRVQLLEKRTQTDDTIENVEQEALERTRKLLPLVTNPMQALRIFEVMNKAHRKSKPVETTNPVQQIVQVSVPVAVAVHLKLSGDNQVVEVNGRSTNTLPSSALGKKLEERKATRAAQITDSSTADELLQKVSLGVKPVSVPNLLQPA